MFQITSSGDYLKLSDIFNYNINSIVLKIKLSIVLKYKAFVVNTFYLGANPKRQFED